jgi:hypothetical protein
MLVKPLTSAYQYPKKLGFRAVINRGPADGALTAGEMRKKENAWFDSNLGAPNVRNKCGSVSLCSDLNGLLGKTILEYLPMILEELTE